MYLYKRGIAITECFKINTTDFSLRDNAMEKRTCFQWVKSDRFAKKKKKKDYLGLFTRRIRLNTTMIHNVITFRCIITIKF